jgi:hypothetical protein
MIRAATLLALALLLGACADYAGSTDGRGPAASSMEMLNLGASLLRGQSATTTNCVPLGMMISCRSF